MKSFGSSFSSFINKFVDSTFFFGEQLIKLNPIITPIIIIINVAITIIISGSVGVSVYPTITLLNAWLGYKLMVALGDIDDDCDGVDDIEFVFEPDGVDEMVFEVDGVDEIVFEVDGVDEIEFVFEPDGVDEMIFEVDGVDEMVFEVDGVDEIVFEVDLVNEVRGLQGKHKEDPSFPHHVGTGQSKLLYVRFTL